MNEVEVLRYEIIKLREDISQLTALLSQVEPVKNEEKSLDKTISDVLLDYNIPVHVKGFRYLKEAIAMELEGTRIEYGMTKFIYPEIAKNHHDTSSRVERAIRHAIEIGWRNRALPKPTNSQFIALVAEEIRSEREGIA